MRRLLKLKPYTLLLIAALMTSARGFASIPVNSKAISGAFVKDANGKYPSFSTLPDGLSQPGVIFNSIQDVISLRVKDEVSLPNEFSYTVTFNVYAYAKPEDALPTPTSHSLSVTYRKGAGVTYKGIDVYNFTGARMVRVDITGVSTADWMPGANMVELKISIMEDWLLPLVQYQAMSVNPSAIVDRAHSGDAAGGTSAELPLSWNAFAGAQEYDLEWTTIANGDANAAVANSLLTKTTPSGEPEALFKNNATRITTSGNSYKITLAYNDDYLVARIRPAQYTADGVRRVGTWTYGNSNTANNYLVWKLDTHWHQAKFNWQYSVTFAEEGKKKEVISYFDGSQRNRQTVTLDNSLNVPIVQENIYDQFGRVLGTILPAPVKDEDNNTPYLQYFPRLNRNISTDPDVAETAYDYHSVIGSGSLTCDFSPAPLSVSSGTSRYFSSNNSFKNDLEKKSNFNQYIPDAQQFPLAVTQYTADNTGHIKMQGGVGPMFQPGASGGKVTRYYYGKPEQWELDQLFGNDVGYAEHYQKNMVLDANGQVSVNYLNASGKTIVTALAGDAPTSLDKLLPLTAVEDQTTHILKPEQFVFDNSSLTLSATTTYLSTKPGVDANFTYNIQKLFYTYAQSNPSICSNCYYDLHIKVVNSCAPNDNLYSGADPVPLGLKVADCSVTGTESNAFTAHFNDIGEYYITFEFVMSRSVMEDYVINFINRANDQHLLNTEWYYLKDYLNRMDLKSILGDCKTASAILGDQATFAQMVDKEIASLGIDLATYTADDVTAYHGWVDAKWTELHQYCISIEANCSYADCNKYVMSMGKDVSPGGQYALFDANYAPLESNINIIAQNYKQIFHVGAVPGDNYYQQFLFTKSDGTITSAADASTPLSDIIQYWQPAWSGYFLKFHPEMCKLQFCMLTVDYQDWDERVKQLALKSSDIPGIKGAPAGFAYNNLDGSWLMAADPFFKTGGLGASVASQMTADLNNYSKNVLNVDKPGYNVKNLSQFVDYTLYCAVNNVACTTDAACWNTCSADACRLTDRNWNMYKTYYFQLKDKYYDLIRNATTCHSNCAVGTPYTAPVPGTSCPAISDFTIGASSAADSLQVTCAANEQSVTIRYTRGTVTGSTYVYLYYPPGTNVTGLPISVLFPANAQRVDFCLPQSINLANVSIRAVNCSGVNPAAFFMPGLLTPAVASYQTPAMTPSTTATGSDFYVSEHYPCEVCNQHYTIKVKPGVGVCTRNGMTATVVFKLDCQNCASGYGYFTVNIDPNSYTGFLEIQANLAATLNSDSYTVLGTISDCAPPAPSNGGCAGVYSIKESRFDFASQTNSYTDKDIATAEANAQRIAQVRGSCEANAETWMKVLEPGLVAGGYTDKRAILRSKLTDFCAASNDMNHPFGASTNAANESFASVFRNALVFGPGFVFTQQLNPWLIDGPPPYDAPNAGTPVMIGRGTPEIDGLVVANKNAWIAANSGLSFYNYLVNRYGDQMTLTEAELKSLQEAKASCNYLLPADIVLPSFFNPAKGGCVTPAAYAEAKAALMSNFPGGLDNTKASYLTILANFMNQRFGFALGYSAYDIYDKAPNGNLCNKPPYAPVIIDQYRDFKSMIAVAVSNAQVAYQGYINDRKEQFRADYISTCSAARPLVDLTSKKQNYHFTLYYYDQADNLVRTIPPAGVTLITNPQTLASIQQIRDNVDVASCGTAFNGPTTTNLSGELSDMSATLATTTSTAIEFWFYNALNNGVQYAQTTADGKFRIQLNVNNSVMTADVYSLPVSGTFSKVNHLNLSLSSLPPLQKWTHITLQAVNLPVTTSMAVYVNGYRANTITATAAVLQPDNISMLKHVRFYNTRVLDPTEIMVNAANSCFMPLNTDALTHWYRFNIPDPGDETTVASNSTLETNMTGIYPKHALATSYAYNATNNVVQQYSPDGGTNRFWYDMLSRLNFSQNDKQLAGNNYSYTLYDELNRVTEVGQKNLTNANLGDPGYVDDAVVTNFNAAGTRSQITSTFYDAKKDGFGLKSYEQNNLRKRVAVSGYRENQGDLIQQATYYNYDIDGNVSTLWQQINGLDTKRIDYEYDLISGKVNFVRYQSQEGTKDHFYRQYEYDDNNRLINAWSGTNALVRPYRGSDILPGSKRLDAMYYYYLHGPLMRMELGSVYGAVQGVDYAYTLQGWIKGVNSQDINGASDIGGDGVATGRSNIAKDVYGYSLGYYTDDYKPIGGTNTPALGKQYLYAAGDSTGRSLYNGNIGSMALSLSGTADGRTNVGYSYMYDQLNRLRKVNFHPDITTWNKASATKDYKEDLLYDANGNITQDTRNGYAQPGPGLDAGMDNLVYRYTKDINGKLVNNRLGYVTDGTNYTGRYTTDIDNQASGNYGYDQIGNLTKDGTTTFNWNVYGKLKTITKSSGNVNYTYDAFGNRVSKTVGTTTTYYVRDVKGNPLAIYENTGTASYLREQHLYGSSRLGIWAPPANLEVSQLGATTTTAIDDAYNIVGQKNYQLSNHLGNVMAIVSDNRLQNAGTSPQTYQADVVVSNDYYAFGMLMPNRQNAISSPPKTYRYGFNGKENDNDAGKGDGNQQDYGMRIYDPRLGRFLSVDPISKQYPELTPYQFASNRPIDGIDQDGLEFKKFDSKYTSTIVFQKEGRDDIMEKEYQLALKAHMNVVETYSLAELAGYLKEKGKKYDNLIFSGHGTIYYSSLRLGGIKYKDKQEEPTKFTDQLSSFKSELKNIGKFVKPEGLIILTACFQSTPKYVLNITPTSDDTGVYPIDGEGLIKQLSRYTNISVLANRGETYAGSKQFSGNALLGAAPLDSKSDYYKLALKFAGQWTITAPSGNVKEVGNVTMDQSGSPGFPAGGPAPITGTDQAAKIPDNNSKP